MTLDLKIVLPIDFVRSWAVACWAINGNKQNWIPSSFSCENAHARFFREALAQLGTKRARGGGRTNLPSCRVPSCAVEDGEMASAGEG